MPRERPLAVAILRIAASGILLATNEPRDALSFVASGAPWSAPEGLRWIAAHAAASPAALASGARAALYAYYVSAVLSLLGLYTRAALATLLASAAVLFGMVQLGGAVVHDMHLLWLLALLLACPSAGGALSVDEWLATTPSDGLRRRLLGPREGSAAAGATVFFARTLLGVIYFFPGLWKLRESGLAWALSDNLVHQMHAKWLEFGVVPALRVDRVPALVHALGLFTLCFELGFLFLVHVGPRARVALAIAGLAFHLGIEQVMLIPFSSLWAMYVVLLPFGGGPPEPSTRGVRSVTVVGALLLVANLVQGLRGKTQSFPFACYPTFQWIAPATLPDLDLTALGDGGARLVPHARDARGRRTQREWGTVWSVAGIYGRPFSAQRLEQYLEAERRRRPAVARALEGARAVRADLVWRWTDPDEWGAPPARVRELAVVSPGAP
jgi:hypothetical protein